MAVTLPRVNSLWIGRQLGYVERGCLLSAAMQGHDVVLYAYDSIDRVPPEIVVRDAREIMPDSYLVKHAKSGSWALSANLFRLNLMRCDVGVWVDADVFFVRPLRLSGPYLFGWQSEQVINNAVLYVQPEDKMLFDYMRYAFSANVIPPWWPAKARFGRQVKQWMGHPCDASDLPWGSLGPMALTHFVSKYRLIAHAHPPDVFYPVHWARAMDLFDPMVNVEHRFTDRTITVHLWNEKIKHLKLNSPPVGSFMDGVYTAARMETGESRVTPPTSTASGIEAPAAAATTPTA